MGWENRRNGKAALSKPSEKGAFERGLWYASTRSMAIWLKSQMEDFMGSNVFFFILFYLFFYIKVQLNILQYHWQSKENNKNRKHLTAQGR